MGSMGRMGRMGSSGLTSATPHPPHTSHTSHTSPLAGSGAARGELLPLVITVNNPGVCGDGPGMLASDLGLGILFERMRDAGLVVEADTGRVVCWNPAAEALFGYAAGEAADLPVAALLPDLRLPPAAPEAALAPERIVELAGLRRSGE